MTDEAKTLKEINEMLLKIADSTAAQKVVMVYGVQKTLSTHLRVIADITRKLAEPGEVSGG